MRSALVWIQDVSHAPLGVEVYPSAKAAQARMDELKDHYRGKGYQIREEGPHEPVIDDWSYMKQGVVFGRVFGTTGET